MEKEDEQDKALSLPSRRYKACRVCRRQKSRCDGQSPCRRCETSGAACIYDRNPGRRRNVTSRNGPSSTQKQRIEDLNVEVQRLKSQLEMSLSCQATRLINRPTLPAMAVGHSSAIRSNCEVLSLDDLEIPVTTVHVMIHPSSGSDTQRNGRGWTPWNQSRWNFEEYAPQSIVAKGMINETEARYLFNDFIQQGNIAAPILDPVLDTYESVSELNPLTFSVILYLAARQKLADDSILLEEIKRLAGCTLFENPCSIDGVQAMILLAMHSEKTWFAIGHAYQMALDLGLHLCMARVLCNPESCSRHDSQGARLWLLIVYFERTIALGSTRKPRCEAIEPASLELLVRCRYSHPSNIFFCASLELFDMSAGLRQLEELPTTDELDSILAKWSAKWDDHHDRNCIHSRSLQRVRLRVQELFAKTWQLAILLVRPLRSKKEFTAQQRHNLIIDLVLQTVHELFGYVSQSEAYQRYFPWCPTSEVLLLTFSIIVGSKVLSVYPNALESSKFKEAAKPIAELLQKHPCRCFSVTIENLLQSTGSPVDSLANTDSNHNDSDWLNGDWNFETQLEELFGGWSKDDDDCLES